MATNLTVGEVCEPLLRQVGKSILERFGYSALLAENGLEAVRIFRQNADMIAAVLLDLTMPKMGRAEALRLIREIQPRIP